MKARQHFSAHIRRYRFLSKRVKRMMQDGSFRLLAPGQQKKLLFKLRQRLKAIGQLLPQPRLREALAGLALLLGTALANPLDAQTFAPAVASPFGIQPGSTYGYPAFTDIDDDGDLDMFVASYDYDTYQPVISFYENSGTPSSPDFSASVPQVNPFGIQMNGNLSTSVFADFDDDGDLDLMAGFLDYGGFIYYENTGSADAPAFAAPQSNPFGLTQSLVDFVTVADLDNDGDLDLLSGGAYSTVRFFENTGTPEAPAFAAPVNNPFGFNPSALITVPNLADLDGDGDFDIIYLAYNYNNGQIRYAENTGTPEAPAFATPITSPFGITTNNLYVAIPITADIDNDGDTDVFINDYYGEVIYFYENTNINIQVPPTAADNTVTVNEDETYAFAAGDFNFMDGNASDELFAVEITSLPSIGALNLNGSPVTAFQVVLAIDLPNLTFAALPDDNGAPYTNFGFRVADDTDWSVDEYVMTIDVNPVNDAPASEDAEIFMQANETYAFAAADFPFSDIEGDDLQTVQITSLEDKGTLRWNNMDVSSNQQIPVADLGLLTYVPAPDEEGVPYTSFGFKVSDGEDYSVDAFTMTINVTGPDASRESQLDAEAVLSPNPAAEFVQLTVEAAQTLDNLHVVIFDETGRTVAASAFGKQGQAFQHNFDVRDFAPGIYFIKVESGGKWKVMKFVKS